MTPDLRRLRLPWLAMVVVIVLGLSFVAADALYAQQRPPVSQSIAHRQWHWPTWEQWRRVLSLQDYNTRVVLFGATMLGVAAGTIGSFTLLRKRALMGDALSHATLPGICLAFVMATVLGVDGKSLVVLLAGAAVTGVLGVAAILVIRRYSHVKEDSALAIVLSVFFGAGTALLLVAQKTPGGHAAGLETFIYGKTASMLASDAYLIAVVNLLVVGLCVVLFKPFKVLCFDAPFGASRGLPALLLDSLMMALVLLVTVVGLQAVGLVLMIAMLVIPAAAARFWTENMGRMTAVSGLLGGVSAMLGAGMSALLPNLPSGAMIVIVAACFFSLSMLLGAARGMLVRGLRRVRLNRKVDAQHLLRAIYEQLEAAQALPPTPGGAILPAIEWQSLLRMRSWSRGRLLRAIGRAKRQGLVEQLDADTIRATAKGFAEAARVVRQHRLWEMYLITHADIAPSHVDRDADLIEHVLDDAMIEKLERLLHQQQRRETVGSPHPLSLET